MSDDGDGCISSIIASIGIIILSCMSCYFSGEVRAVKKQAIDYGFAIYDVDTTTGDATWRWKTPEEVCAAKEGQPE